MKILLVDDDIGIRASLVEFLSDLGNELYECDNGRSALKFLKKNEINVVISDIRMPEMNGNELLKEIKKTPEIKNLVVVLYTGFGNIKNAIDAMKNGAYDYLLKPINIEELASIIEKIDELLGLREENKKLTNDFNKTIDIATSEIRNELTDLRVAYAREVSNLGIGVFSESLKKVTDSAERLHKNMDVPVLIEGSTGTGKEVIARYIHFGKNNCVDPFVAINCASISSNLFESELFGYEPGAFTGGNPKGQKGKIELAENGTLFLDELSEISVDYQAKLLRVIQEREYYRVGGLKKKITNARFICSTNKDIIKLVEEGKFREDLYYRLAVGHIIIPELCERKEEIMPFAKMFLDELRSKNKTTFLSISEPAKKILLDYDWPGNIRQLKGVIERISLFWDDTKIMDYHVLQMLTKGTRKNKLDAVKVVEDNDEIVMPYSGFNLDGYVLKIVKKALEKHKQNKTDTAKYLGISRKVLYTYIKHIEENIE